MFDNIPTQNNQGQYIPNNGNNNKQQDTSYFGMMKKRYQNEPNFIWYLKPEQIQKSAKDRIFKEMIRGQIDYSENGQYFQDSKFLDNLIQAAKDELINNSEIRDALYIKNTYFPGNQDTIRLLARYQGLTFVFNILYTHLMNLKYSGNVGEIANIQYELGNYRNLL